jgi:hypothetical protein
VKSSASPKIYAAAAIAGALFFFPGRSAVAQEAVTAAQSTAQADVTPNLKELLGALQEMKGQMQSLNTRLGEVSAAQTQAAAEAQRLREELAAANLRIKALEPASKESTPAVTTYSTTPGPKNAEPKLVSLGLQGTSTDETLDERLNRIEENSQLLDSKIAGQDRSKVESGSKYRIRLSGLFLFNLYGVTGNVNNQDFPEFGTPPGFIASDHAFGGSIRQSQIGIEGFGPDLLGAHTSASLRFDFAGALLQEENGALMGGVRLRTGTFRMDWANTSLIAGQDFLFFAPLAPTSLATVAIPAMSYSGNLWAWTPQVRVEHRFHVAENATIAVTGGILDQATGDIPEGGQDREPSWGEQSGQPGYGAHVAWERKTSSGMFSLGGGGYYGLQAWGYGRTVDSWAGLVDLQIPLSHYFEFSAQVYRGRGIGGFGAGLGQSILFSGSPADPASQVRGLDSIGGWAQLKYKARANLEFNAAFGQENPYASQIREYSIPNSAYDESLGRNQSWFVNFIYQPKSNIFLSLEFRRLKTREIGGDLFPANHVNLSLGYQF